MIFIFIFWEVEFDDVRFFLVHVLVQLGEVFSLEFIVGHTHKLVLGILDTVVMMNFALMRGWLLVDSTIQVHFSNFQPVCVKLLTNIHGLVNFICRAWILWACSIRVHSSCLILINNRFLGRNTGVQVGVDFRQHIHLSDYPIFVLVAWPFVEELLIKVGRVFAVLIDLFGNR